MLTTNYIKLKLRLKSPVIIMHIIIPFVSNMSKSTYMPLCKVSNKHMV